MVVCKLTEGGFLKRCYICPDCQLSYYDEFSHADGFIPDSGCIAHRQEHVAQQKAQEERRIRIEQQKAQKAARPSVEKRIKERQKALRKGVFFGLLGLLVLGLVLVWVW